MFFGQTRADIPVGCDYVVQLSGGYRGVLINAAEKSKTVPFVSSQISDTLAVRIVRTLAPVCTDEVSLEGELIKNISMFKMLNILSVEDLDLKQDGLRLKLRSQWQLRSESQRQGSLCLTFMTKLMVRTVLLRERQDLENQRYCRRISFRWQRSIILTKRRLSSLTSRAEVW